MTVDCHGCIREYVRVTYDVEVPDVINATGSGRGRMDRIGSTDRHISRTSRADQMHMNTDCDIVSCLPSSFDGNGGCEPMRFGVITNV
jgi:hypothetical protein